MTHALRERTTIHGSPGPDRTRRHERLLLEAYQAHSRDSRHPVVCLSESTVISNAAAARMLAVIDQVAMWELAGRLRDGGASAQESITISDGTVLDLGCTPVHDGAQVIGAVLRAHRRPTPSRTGARRSAATPAGPATGLLDGLGGTGAQWQRMSGRLTGIGAQPVLLAGEPGTGKRTIAHALCAPFGDVVELDAERLGGAGWLEVLRGALSRRPSALVMLHVQCLDMATTRTTTHLLGSHEHAGTRMVAAATVRTSQDLRGLLDHVHHLVEVPALRDRLEDLPGLLRILTAKHHPAGAVPPRWMPDAVQALRRIEWPSNLHSLDSVVRDVLAHQRVAYIGAGNLPPSVTAHTSRRKLARLEQIEANAILASLDLAGGNKQLAAETLGIARSTLYRKIRALGVDLTSANF